MKKKKVLIALLASLCVTASAAGLAACKDTNTSDGPTYDPALYAAYQTYVSSFAESEEQPKSYEEWVADILAQLASKPEKGEPGPQGPEGPAGELGDNGENGVDGEDGVGIEDISLWEDSSGKQYLQFTLTSGKIIRLPLDGEGEPIVSTAFNINAVDQYGNPVIGAYFSVGYMNPSTYMHSYLKNDGTVVSNASNASAAKSNRYGIATFYSFPSDTEREYGAYIADSYATGGVDGVPVGYTANLGSLNGIPNLSVPFTKDAEGNYTVTVHFTLSNGWGALYDGENDLKYKRYVADYKNPDQITEESTPYVKRASRNRYNFFTLRPFHVEYPANMDGALESLIDDLALKAASGIYRISWAASSSAANVELELYEFTGNNIRYTSNDDGSPSDGDIAMRSGTVPTDESVLQAKYQKYAKAYGAAAMGYNAWYDSYAASFSGSNYVDVEIEYDTAHLPYCLGFVSDINCNVTISVERIGDARVWTDIFDVKKMPSNASAASAGSGRITDVPFTSTLVKDNNGNYRIGSTSGPLVYVQLNNPTRANPDSSMISLAQLEVDDGNGGVVTKSVFNYLKEEFDATTNTGKRIYTDYTDVVKGYSKLANNDGLYPVNDLIKGLLEEYCMAYFRDYQHYNQYWLAACYYYGPEPDGSADAPYDLSTGNNSVTLNGATYVAFKPTTTGYYGFSSTAGQISIANSVDVAGAYYVKLNAYEEFKFTINGNGGTTVKVETISAAKTIEYTYGEYGIVGTDANPVTIAGSGVYLVNINHDVSNGEKVAVDLSATYMADGNYKIEIYGSATAEVLDATLSKNLKGTTVALTNATPTRLWIDDTVDGTFFMKITKQ